MRIVLVNIFYNFVAGVKIEGMLALLKIYSYLVPATRYFFVGSVRNKCCVKILCRKFSLIVSRTNSYTPIIIALDFLLITAANKRHCCTTSIPKMGKLLQLLIKSNPIVDFIFYFSHKQVRTGEKKTAAFCPAISLMNTVFIRAKVSWFLPGAVPLLLYLFQVL
jgi:hypothetical protein